MTSNLSMLMGFLYVNLFYDRQFLGHFLPHITKETWAYIFFVTINTSRSSEKYFLHNCLFLHIKKTSEHAKEDATDFRNAELRSQREHQVFLNSTNNFFVTYWRDK